MNQIVLFRVATVFLGVLALSFLVAGLCIHPEFESGEKQARLDAELTDLLQRLRATRDQQARERILRDGRREGRLATKTLRRILQNEEHPLLSQAVEYAGALGVAELRPDVVPWAERGGPEERALAVRAAEQLGPWTSQQLSAFLNQESVPVQLAVLEIASRRSDAPWQEILSLLSSEDPKVRRAVLAALPSRPTPEAVTALRAALEADSTSVVVAALDTLSRTEAVAELEGDIMGLVADQDPRIQAAALHCLAAKGSPVAHVDVLHELVLDRSAEPYVRARALHCLERTGSDLGELRRRFASLEPLLQYFAARCLVSAGDPEGGRLLLELVEDSSGADAGVASRQLLASLTHLSPGSTSAEFRSRLEQEPPRAGPLPPPGVAF